MSRWIKFTLLIRICKNGLSEHVAQNFEDLLHLPGRAFIAALLLESALDHGLLAFGDSHPAWRIPKVKDPIAVLRLELRFAFWYLDSEDVRVASHVFRQSLHPASMIY